MLQAVMTKPGSIIYNEIPIPDCKDGEILIKTKAIGVCGSDIHVYHGKHPYTSYPVVQGHEVCGEVVAVGDNVTLYKVGDRVAIQPQVVCGKCYPCTHGRYHICDDLRVMGFQTTGVASEYFAIPQEKGIKLPDNWSFELGAMLEPVAVGVHAVLRGGDVSGKKVLVLGAGTIGNLTAQVAKGMGADEVMITDLNEFRLSIAKQCGIDHCINTATESLDKALKRCFDGAADVIIECVGVDDTMTSAIMNARKGSDIIVVGVFAKPAMVDLGLVQDRELRLIGTAMYQECDFLTAVNLITENRVDTSPLVTHRFEFSDYLKAYQFIDENANEVMKAVITFEG